DDRGEAGRFAAQGGGETGDAGADDHHVRLDGPPGLGRVQAGPGARLRVVGDGRRGAGAKRTRLRVVVGDGRGGAGAERARLRVVVGDGRRGAGAERAGLRVVVGDGRRGAGAKRTRLRVVVGDGRAYACAGHEAAPNVPKVRGMLSISRVDPTRAATASTASPVKSSPMPVKSAGSTRAR